MLLFSKFRIFQSTIHSHSTYRTLGIALPNTFTVTASRMICSKTERNVLSPNPNPFHYRLHLIPDLTNFIFKGTVQIELDVLAPTDTIIMNALDLTFQDVVVHQGEDIVAKIDGPDVRFDAENERAQIHLPSGMMKQGKARLTINYTGILNDKLKGFYRSRYTSKTSDDKCVDRYMGTTQFEPTDARRALPCWDEPARKATFQVSMTIPSHLTALSNTGEISSTTVANNLKCVTFSKTPVMSTYLLAFAVGEFDWIGSVIPKSRGGTTTLRVFTLPGESHRGRYALELAERILPMYETFFGSDYELEKLDQLAIPDFSAGAMENWGLVTYRETALLCDDSSSATAKERVALVVAHELAHQWFGNLVTMDWWKELWLNESFATWVEYLAVDRLYPSWDMWTQFVNDEKGRALELDALVSSHPIEVEIRNAQEVDEIFDAISYSKGGAVLNMIVSFIGVDTLTSALSKYLSHFKFRNATTKDLWSFLEKESGKPVTQIMSTWTDKQGYPVLEVSCAGPKALRVSQRRFLSTGQVSPELDQIVWPIPVRVMAGTTIVDTIFSEREGTIEIDTTNAPYVLVNPGQTAVCRVLYSPEMFQSMVKHVSQMKSVDRLGIVRDAEAFAQAGCQRTSDLLMLLGAICPHERDLTVWCTVASAEAAVKKLLSDRPDLRTKYNAWAASLYKPCAAALGWDARPEDDHRTLQMRGLVCRRLVASRDVEALSKGRTLFQQFLRDPSQVAGDIRLAVFMSEVQGGGWEAVRAVYENATDAAEKTRCLVALGCLDDEASLQRALEYALSDKVRSQDICSLLASLCNNRAGLDLVSNYIKVNFQSLFDNFGGYMLTELLKCMDEYGSVEKANEIEAWWLTIPESQRQVADRSVKQVVEVIRNRASWKCRSNDDIEKFLQKV